MRYQSNVVNLVGISHRDVAAIWNQVNHLRLKRYVKKSGEEIAISHRIALQNSSPHFVRKSAHQLKTLVPAPDLQDCNLKSDSSSCSSQDLLPQYPNIRLVLPTNACKTTCSGIHDIKYCRKHTHTGACSTIKYS